MLPLNEKAFLHIKDLISQNYFSYGIIYSETKLAKELGISRTPLRDAIHRLAQEGYIDIIPSKGFCIHQLTTQDVNDTFQIRSALECYCTFHITQNYTDESAVALFDELEILMGHMKEILDTTQDIEAFCEYDFSFHTKIVTFLHNAQFITVFNTYMYRMRKLAALSLAHEGRMLDTYNEHRAILDAMKAGDLSTIYTVTMAHMNTPRGINLDDLLDEHLTNE